MRWLVMGAMAVACVLAGCGEDERSAGKTSPGLYTGTSSQGLAVSVQSYGDSARVALTWVGRCRGARSSTSGDTTSLTEETFYPGQLPATINDQRREPGVDGDASTYLRHIELTADAAGMSGRFRIRTRQYNGEARAVDALCDTGEVSFSVTPVAPAQIPPVNATQTDFREATFQEQIIEALANLDYTVVARDPHAFCALLTKRLKRTYCKGRRATINRMEQQLQGITDDDNPARHSGHDAVVVFQTGDETNVGGRTTHGVRTLRFSGSISRGWFLDRVGRRRQVPGPG